MQYRLVMHITSDWGGIINSEQKAPTPEGWKSDVISQGSVTSHDCCITWAAVYQYGLGLGVTSHVAFRSWLIHHLMCGSRTMWCHTKSQTDITYLLVSSPDPMNWNSALEQNGRKRWSKVWERGRLYFPCCPPEAKDIKWSRPGSYEHDNHGMSDSQGS